MNPDGSPPTGAPNRGGIPEICNFQPISRCVSQETFLPRYSEVYAALQCLPVCLSVRLSHWRTVSKQQSSSPNNQHWIVAQGLQCTDTKHGTYIFRGSPHRDTKYERGVEKLRCHSHTNMRLCLVNRSRQRQSQYRRLTRPTHRYYFERP